MKVYLCQTRSTESKVPSVPFSQMALAAQIEDIAEVKISGYYEDGTHPPAEKILKSIDEFKPDVVGITISYAVAAYASIELAKKIKKYNSDITIIAGGHHATFTYESLLKTGYIDAVFLGEGEVSLRKYVLNGTYENVKGVVYKKGKEIIATGRNEPMDVNNLRPPAYHLLPNDGTRLLMGMESSRGCPYNCDFCETRNFFASGKLRKMEISKFINNIRRIVDVTGGGNFVMLDDCFTADMKGHVRQVAEALKVEKFPISIFYQGRVDNLLRNLDMLPLLSEAKFNAVLLGIESIYQERLNMMNKRAEYDEKKIKELIKACYDNNISVLASMVFGYPDETKKMVEDTANYLVSLNVETASMTIATPIPGSALYTRAKDRGEILTDDFTKYDGMHRIMKTIPEKTEGWTNDARRKFFLRPDYYRKIIGNVLDAQKAGIGSFMPAGIMSHNIWMEDQARPRYENEWHDLLKGVKLVINDFLNTETCKLTMKAAFTFDEFRLVAKIVDGKIEEMEFSEEKTDLTCETDGDTLLNMLVWCPLDIISMMFIKRFRINGLERNKTMEFVQWFNECQKVLRWAISMKLVVPYFRKTYEEWINEDKQFYKKMNEIVKDRKKTIMIGQNDGYQICLVMLTAEKVDDVYVVSRKKGYDYDYECSISDEEYDAILNGDADVLKGLLQSERLVKNKIKKEMITDPASFFNSIEEKFIPEKASDVSVGIQYEISYNESKTEDWYMKIEKSKLMYGSGKIPGGATATIGIEHPAFVELINGQATPFKLYSDGRINLNGLPQNMLQMVGCFNNLFNNAN